MERFIALGLRTLETIEIQQKFMELKEQWRKETYTVSSTTKLMDR